MAKRYIKRYYIRPQNIFCSNKAEILNALVKEVGENNCSVYSLKALEDHDDVHLLQPKDIIYYYDNGILYDKNHVKVMDYDLNVKHEEERKKFGNVDAVSDATFEAEYKDRLTETLTEAVNCSKEELEDIFKTVLKDPATLEEIRNLGIAEFNIESDTDLINKLMAIYFNDIFIEPNSNYVYGHPKFDNIDHKAVWSVLRNKALAIVNEKDNELKAIEQEKAKETKAKIAAAKEAELAIRKAKDTLPEETIKAEAEKAAKQDFNKHVVDLYNKINTDIKKARDSSGKHGSKWDIRELTPVEIWAKLRFYENFNDDIYNKDTWGDEAGRYKPLFNIYYYLEYKKLKDIRTLNGKTASAIRDLFDTDEVAKKAKINLKEWLIRNISYIEFIVPTGNVANIWEGDFDEELLNKIDDHFLTIQHKLFKDYNIRGIDESLDHTGTTTIGTNIKIKWRNAETVKTETVLNWYLTEWQLASNVIFKVPAKDFPIELTKLANNLNISIDNESKIISSNRFVYAIINGLFENNLNFLALANNLPSISYDIETTNPFNLEFDDINAYGEKIDDRDSHYQENLSEATSSKKFICCICGEESEGYGNNPEPVRKTGRCCDACNRKFVIPARIEAINLDME